MPNERLHRLLCRFTDIRPDEAEQALQLFLYFFLTTFSIYIIKPIKESFLIDVTPAWWPYADFITAGLIGFVVAFNTRLLNRWPRRKYFSWATISFIVLIILFWCVFKTGAPDSPIPFTGTIIPWIQRSWPVPVFVFCFWSDIFIVMSVTHFWLAVNDVFNHRQAKRTISFFVTGGLLGGIIGSLSASRLAHTMGPENLLLIGPVVLLLILAIINHLYAGRKKLEKDISTETARMKPDYLESLRSIRKNKYLRILAGAIASAIIVGSLINTQFKIAVRQAIPTDEARTSFLASFFLAILLISAIFHLLSTGQILKNFGIRFGLLLAPSVLCLGTLAVFLFPAAGIIAWACFIRGSDKTFDNTISQSLRELLYIPIPPSIKYEAKIFIDMFVNKVAVGLGAALFWILYRISSFDRISSIEQIRQLGILIFCFAILSIILIWKIHAEYLATVKKDLSRKWQDPHKVLAENMDVDRARLIADTLQSREVSSTLYAMNLFHLIRKETLTPELKEFLTFREGEVKARSMDSLLDVAGEVFYPGIEETLAEKETETMVTEIMDLDVYRKAMEARFRAIIKDEAFTEIERMEAAKLIGFMKPTPIVIQCLDHLLRDSSLSVINYALSSAAMHRCAEHVSPIIALLENPMSRYEAQNALASYGPGIEDILRVQLQNEAYPLEVRSTIPDILARIGNQKAADILCVQLSCGNEELEADLVDSLYKIHSMHPKIHFKKKTIENGVLSIVRKTYNLYLSGAENKLSPDLPDSVSDPNPAVGIMIKRIFDLLTLIYPSDDIVKAYQNITQGTHKKADASLELLDNVLGRDIRLYLFPLIEDLPLEERIRHLKRLVKGLDQRLVMVKPRVVGRFV
ncbi:MAG: MFS transporter [Acidobacteria bacterium]|nr:MFS transporter [Acidobacteriota bacterium]